MSEGTGLSADTDAAATRVYFSVICRLTGEERAARAAELSDNLRETVAAGVRQRHPDYTPEQVQWAVVQLTLGRELFQAAFPDRWVEP